MAGLWFWNLILSTVCQKVYSNDDHTCHSHCFASKKVHASPLLPIQHCSLYKPFLGLWPAPKVAKLKGKIVQINSKDYRPFLGLWPAPKVAKLKGKIVQINPKDYSLNLDDTPLKTRTLLQTMTEETLENLLIECGSYEVETGKTNVTFHIFVTCPDVTLTWDSSEKYTLEMKMLKNDVSLQVKINADTVYGARHALETFTQLTVLEKILTNQSCTISVISSAKIVDEPVFKHRGLLLDTSKHFIHISSIKRILDGMAASKMNVFHWHATEAHNFSLESEFNRYIAHNSLYTKADIQDIMHYAQSHGIRVVIEIDGPAHVQAGWNWRNIHMYNRSKEELYNILQPCRLGSRFHMTRQNTFNDLRSLFKKLTDDLPKPMLHMGGDWVSQECWNASVKLMEYMENDGCMHNEDKFFEHWANVYNKILVIWDEEYKANDCEEWQPVMLWSSDLTRPNNIRKYLNVKRYIIELWDRLTQATDLLRKGYRIVLAPSSAWYLNNSECTWLDMYSYKFPDDSNVLGGEAVMWFKDVEEQNLESLIWPRAAAVAERLWSDPDSALPRKTTKARLERHRERLIARGFKPGMLSDSVVYPKTSTRSSPYFTSKSLTLS